MKLPVEFSVVSSSKSGIDTLWDVGYQENSFKCAIPVCFDGPGNGASPEDLYALALLNCFIATFKVYAEKSKLNFKEIAGSAKLIVDKDSSGEPWMAKVNLEIQIFSPDNPTRAERLLNKVADQSMIINSVKSDVEIKWKIL